MFEEIFEKIKETVSAVVAGNSDIHPDHKEGIAGEALSSITEEIKKVASKGNFSALSGLVSGKEAPQDNPHIQQISGNFAQNLMEKFGLDAAKAKSISTSVIPEIFNQLKEKFGKDGFDAKSLLSQLNFSDIMKMMKGNDTDNGGGIFGKLKNMFNK